MSNHKNIEKENSEQGFILDSCGESERYYDYGHNIDLCGLDPKEIVEALGEGVTINSCCDSEIYYDYGRYINLCGLNPKEIVENTRNAADGGSSKTKISISGIVSEKDNEYFIDIKSSLPVVDIVTITLLINENEETIVLQPGDTSYTLGPVDKYSEISIVNITPSSSSVAKYSVNIINPNGNGKFDVKIIEVKNNVETVLTTKEYKYNEEVDIVLENIEGYDFIKWDNGLENGTDQNIKFIMPENNVTIKCYYEIKTFTITFVNEDGTELQKTIVEYGTLPSYNGQTPTKEQTKEFTYEFNGWSPEINKTNSDITYTATFKETKRSYTVNFINEDGTVLNSQMIEYGTLPSYNGPTPTKESTEEFIFAFEEWIPEITKVESEQTYTAKYSSEVRSYMVYFIDEENNILEQEESEYGTLPSYNGPTPTKEPTKEFTYEFNGWIPEITKTLKDMFYATSFKEIKRKYDITFINEDGTIMDVQTLEYGTLPSYNGQTPTKEENVKYSYTFEGWVPEVTNVNGEATYTAKFKENIKTYTVEWLNTTGEVLEKDENVQYGTLPSYNGPTPTKEPTKEFTYEFNGWDKPITEVTGLTVYTATFIQKPMQYTIEWLNWDDSILTSTTVNYGATPVYPNENPTKPSDVQYSYIFDKWEPEITEVTENTTYKALYNNITNVYTVTWKNCDNTIITTEKVEYGSMPTEPQHPTYEKEHYLCDFISWDKEVEIVTGNTTYTAIFNEIPIQYELNVIVENGQYEIEPQKETYIYNEEVTITIIPIEGYQYQELTDKIRITGNMTLTYECTPIKYDLTVDNSYKGQQPYGKDISEYLTFEPKEGTTHKWMEGNEEFTGNTMPNRDLILTSKYTEKPAEDIMIYYGSKLINELDMFNNENITNNLNSFTYNETITNYGNLTPPFKQPTLNNDNVWEEFYDKNDSSIWEENGFVNCILAPKNLTVNLSVDGTNLNTIKQYNTYTINGIEYNLYIGQPSQPYDSYFNGSGAEYTNAIIIITK